MRRRLLTLAPDDEPLWVRLYVQPYETHWTAMIVGEDVPRPDLGTLRG